MSKCNHPAKKLTQSVRVELPRSPRTDVVVKLEIFCRCGARLTFLGLPTAWQPAAPHPRGSEDDGVDPTTVYLPADWLEKPSGGDLT